MMLIVLLWLETNTLEHIVDRPKVLESNVDFAKDRNAIPVQAGHESVVSRVSINVSACDSRAYGMVPSDYYGIEKNRIRNPWKNAALLL